jgi:DNA-binding transcriptional ArsR family regulator
MEKNTLLELKRRREIYEFISQNSGLHLHDISRKMNVPITSLRYHLHSLEKEGLVILRKDGGYNRYFISLEIGENEKKILNCFRRRTALHIILCFFIAVQCSQKDLSRVLEKSPATVSFHLRNMVKAGIIEQVTIKDGVIHKDTLPSTIKRPQVSSEKIYVLKDPWMMYGLLLKHKEHLGEKNFVDYIIEHVEFFISEGIPKEVQNREDTINSVVNAYCRFFFPPSFRS